jgi:hypothetical protein
MTYTFWHANILIGESDLTARMPNRRQLGGIYRPTDAGLSLMPLLCSADALGEALKRLFGPTGQPSRDLSEDEARELVTGTDDARRVVEYGQVMSELELRAPNGQALEFGSIAFNDLDGFRQLGKQPSPPFKAVITLARSRGENAPQYIVSATLTKSAYLRRAIRKPFARTTA